MRQRHSSILIIVCWLGLGFDHNPASAVKHIQTVPSIKLAQANNIGAADQSPLIPGSSGVQVKRLQTQLKQLGYYDGEVDGQYGVDTSLAVSKFQEAKGLTADGIVGRTTWQSLQALVKKDLVTSPNPTTIPTPKPNVKQEEGQTGIVWWSLIGIGVLGSFGALLYLTKWFGKPTTVAKYPEVSTQVKINPVALSIQELNTMKDGQSKSAQVIDPQELLPVEKTSRIAKINIVDQLIEDLRNTDPTQRRKVIWDLGQQGDSRAIQPLVELMMDADSQQRNLILAALAEIGTRTLKPLNRALAISMQDESPQVRTNAIRDLTRIYDMMAQVSQMLSHAVYDSDADVQAIARYALSQMNRIRSLPSQEKEEQKDSDGEEENNQ